jgi:hypothetical protein
MLAHCDKCDSMFDSHDGGTIVVQSDGKPVTYCPKCEQLYDPEGLGLSEIVSDGGVCSLDNLYGFTADQTAALDEAAREDSALGAYERGLDSTAD